MPKAKELLKGLRERSKIQVIHDTPDLRIGVDEDLRCLKVTVYRDGHWYEDVLLELPERTGRWEFKSLPQIAPSCSRCGMQSIMCYPNCPYCRARMENGR